MCDGTAVSRTTYTALFTVIGTTYGAGDGSTTFNVPDMRGRAGVGAGQGAGLTNRVLGASGGAETHTLVSGEMPAHSHGVTDPGHAHMFGAATGGDSNASATSNSYIRDVATNSATTGIGIQNTGGGGAHNNMQPFMVLNYIIKT